MKFNPWMLLLALPALALVDWIITSPDYSSANEALTNCQKELRYHMASRDLFWQDKRILSKTCFIEKKTGFRDRMSVEGRVLYIARDSSELDRKVIVVSPRRYFACDYYGKTCPPVTNSWQ